MESFNNEMHNKLIFQQEHTLDGFAAGEACVGRQKMADELKNALSELGFSRGSIIGISGFGGSGKSTIANHIGMAQGAPVISVDSFFKRRGVASFSHWDIIDYNRLIKEVIKPFRNGIRTIQYGHFNWNADAITDTISLQNIDHLLVEGVGIFRPDVIKCVDIKIWINCDINIAIQRGKLRDRCVYRNPQDELWDGIWKRNDLECYNSYRPLEMPGILVVDNNKVREPG